MSIVYQAYCPGHYSIKRGLPYLRNGEIVYPPDRHEWIPRENKKLFKNEDKCLKYCVKHGFQYEQIQGED